MMSNRLISWWSWFSMTLLMACLIKPSYAGQVACNAHIEMDDDTATFDKMSLDVVAIHTGATQESSPCTPDGNCFVVIYNLDQFALKMRGPAGAVFEPSQYAINLKTGQTCEDLTFKLKGFVLKMQVVTATAKNGQDIDGPDGLTVYLKEKGSAVATEKTAEGGWVAF